MPDPAPDLDLAVHALFHEAVSRDELNEWAMLVLGGPAEYPPCVVDLVDFAGHPKDLIPLVGRSLAPLSAEERKALTGIAHARGMASPYAQFARETALRALDRSPALLERFEGTFPFIAVPRPPR